MTIKTGRIRRLYDEALNNNIISPNMLMMAISALNNEINYNDKLISKTVADYIKYRNIITKEAINNGVSKNRLINVIRTLSPERYPSYNQILKLITLINSEEYLIAFEETTERERKIMCLVFGFVKNIYFTPEEVANIVHMPKKEVLETLRINVPKYKEQILRLKLALYPEDLSIKRALKIRD